MEHAMAKNSAPTVRASRTAARKSDRTGTKRGAKPIVKSKVARPATKKARKPVASRNRKPGVTKASTPKAERGRVASPAKRTKGNLGTLRVPSRKPKMLNSTHVEGTMVDGVLVAKLKCEKLGEYEASIVQGDISAAAKGTSWKVALDFTDVQLISSVGLGLIVTLNKAAKTNKGRMSMFNLNPNLLNLFKITRLDSGLLIKSTAQEAIEAVK